MGWNEGGRIFEGQIIEAYDAGLLTPKLLDALAEPFKGTDCDTGGFEDKTARDGLSAEMIICKVMDPEGYEDAIADPDYDLECFEACGEDPEDADMYVRWANNNKAWELFRNIWNGRWGIW